MEAQFNECILLFSDMPAVDIDQVVVGSMEIFTSTPASLTWRQHEAARDEPGPLDMSPLPINVLKMEKVGRISGAELLSLLEEKKTVCVDIRTNEEYKVGTLQSSVNVPFDAGENTACGEMFEAAKSKGQVIAVMGSSKDNQALIFAERLLSLGYPRVATLHGGVEVFYGAGALIVPHA